MFKSTWCIVEIFHKEREREKNIICEQEAVVFLPFQFRLNSGFESGCNPVMCAVPLFEKALIRNRLF